MKRKKSRLDITLVLWLALTVGLAAAAAQEDFGDCPQPYPTVAADNGARHGAADPNLFLGEHVDLEPDGQPSVMADGDDVNGVADDEDGVSFLSSLLPAEVADVEIVASAAGLLDAWLDFNIDGDWDDPGEQIFIRFPLHRGPNLLCFNVPSVASFGDTYARFRLSTAGGLDPNGPAADGEVEDYLVLIEDCLTPDEWEYDIWVRQGKPKSWCCKWQPSGDANGDGIINIIDVLLIRPPHFNVFYGDPTYDCRVDFNHDGYNGLNDLLLLRPPNFNVVLEEGYFCPYADDCGSNP